MNFQQETATRPKAKAGSRLVVVTVALGVFFLLHNNRKGKGKADADASSKFLTIDNITSGPGSIPPAAFSRPLLARPTVHRGRGRESESAMRKKGHGRSAAQHAERLYRYEY